MEPAQWRKICQHHPMANFLQSPTWAKVNQLIGHQVIIETFNHHSSALMIIKNAKRGRYLEIPGGPLLYWQDSSQVKAAFQKIRAIAKQYHCVFIRFRPQLLKNEQNLALLSSTNSRPAPFHLHAQHTLMLDLTKSENQLLSELRRQTRYEVRRAAKLGLIVEHGNSPELFQKFHQIQSATAARQKFIPPSLEELLAYREAFAERAQIYLAKTPNQELIAMGLILIDGQEAEYFEAASTKLNRQFPGAYALQWQVIQDLKKQGIPRYNLWGVAPAGQTNHRYSKVTTFKTGFGGEVIEFIPAQDIILNPLKYQLVFFIETLRKKRRRLS